jgi:hypothetical protein
VVRVRAELGGEKFERGFPVKLIVLSEVDLTHTARSEERDDPILLKLLADF